MSPIIVLYDGVCLFCEGWVNFVIDKKRDDVDVYFIPLEKVVLGRRITEQLRALGADSDSIVYVSSEGEFFTKSDASLRVMTRLVFPFSLLAKSSLLIPRFLRNFVYDQIGRRRYDIWGKRDACILPSGERRQYFINSLDDMPVAFLDSYESLFKFKEQY